MHRLKSSELAYPEPKAALTRRSQQETLMKQVPLSFWEAFNQLKLSHRYHPDWKALTKVVSAGSLA